MNNDKIAVPCVLHLGIDEHNECTGINIEQLNINIRPLDSLFEIKKVIQNGNATIVFWADKTKTVVKRKEYDDNDVYAAVAQALAKKIYGSTGIFHKIIDQNYIYQGPIINIDQNYIINSFSKFFNGIWRISHPEDKSDS